AQVTASAGWNGDVARDRLTRKGVVRAGGRARGRSGERAARDDGDDRAQQSSDKRNALHAYSFRSGIGYEGSPAGSYSRVDAKGLLLPSRKVRAAANSRDDTNESSSRFLATGQSCAGRDTVGRVKMVWQSRIAETAAKYGEHAPTAAVCCNACRTC